MNWFLVVVAMLYVGAGFLEASKGNWAMAVVYFSFSLSNIALSVVGIK